jgi:two-component system sensor histidine kinase YesM
MLSILLPFVMLGILSYRQYINTINENLVTHNETMSELFAERVNDFFRQLDHFYFSLYNSHVLQNVGKIEAGDFDSVRYFLEMNRAVDSLVAFYGLTGTIDSVLTIDGDGRILYQSGQLMPSHEKVNFRDLAWLEQGGRYVSLPYYSQTAQRGSYTGQHIAYFRHLGMISEIEERVYVILEVRLNSIVQILESLSEQSNHTLVLAENSNLISQVGDIYLPSEVITEVNEVNRLFTEEIDGRSFIVVSYPIQGTSWTFLSIIEEEDLFGDASRLRNFTLLLTLAAFAFASVLSILISFSLTVPIKKIKNISQRIMEGETDIQIPLVSKDEIGELGQCMDNMLSRTHSLLTEKYVMEIRQKEAQLYALQVQINPHFLYNTMETIRAMATMAGAQKISDVAMDTVDMFRYSIKSTSLPATLRDEIKHVGHYLSILKLRHEERLEYKLDIEEGTVEYQVERLLLQPLVENAVKHGIEPKRKGGLICITAKQENGSLLLTVEDEGVGIPKETLRKLRLKLLEDRLEYQGEHIGLSNIYDRLRLRYGVNFSFDIESEYGVGTKVVISIPLLENER